MTATLPRLGEVVEVNKPDAGDEVLYSVTSVLGVLDKPALIPWAVGETAKWVVQLYDVLGRRLQDEGEEEAKKWVEGLRWRTGGLLKAAEIGTLAHSLFEEYALSGQRPEVRRELHPDFVTKRKLLDIEDQITLRRMLDQFDAFLQQFQPEFLATEVVVFSPSKGFGEHAAGYGYAGTCDGLVRIGGETLIIDYKTSRDTYTKAGALRGPYPEVGLQLAAYRYAQCAAIWRARRAKLTGRRYYLLSGEERESAVAMPRCDGGAAIYVTPERYGVYPVRCGIDVFEAFLYVLEVARWQFNWAAQMVGNPMTPPTTIVDDLGDPFEGLPA